MPDQIFELEESSINGMRKILRKASTSSRILYLHIDNIEWLQRSQQGLEHFLSDLSELEGWYDDWSTATIDYNGNLQRDAFSAPLIPANALDPSYPRFNIPDITLIAKRQATVKLVEVEGKRCYLKAARYPHEIDDIKNEIKVYQHLTKRTPFLVPRLVGYAYEDTKERVTGFVTEEVEGARHATVEDLRVCEEAVLEMHDADVIHNDLNKFNLLVAADGKRKMIDFEISELGDDTYSEEQWTSKKEREYESVGQALEDTDEGGKPFYRPVQGMDV